jgi:hypothetical protein
MAGVRTIAAMRPPKRQERFRAGTKRLSRVMGVTENIIHKALVERLELGVMPGVFWCHIPNGEYRAKITAARLRQMGVKAGVPDFLFIIDGVPHFLELKREGGTISDKQKETFRSLQNAGARVGIAYGFNDAAQILQVWRVLR